METYNVLHPIYDPVRGGHHGARIARVQIALALVLGVLAFLAFCLLRVRYPRIYVANLTRLNYVHSVSRQKLPRLPRSLFAWIPVVFRVTEAQVLEHAGLDAVVFLGFFKMSIKALAVCVVFALGVISPVRLFYTGRVDMPDPDDPLLDLVGSWLGRFPSWFGLQSPRDESYPAFLWMYLVFTYVFTFVIIYFLRKQTIRIIAMRQQYLGRQCLITDRTIKILGIPPFLRDDEPLKRHITALGVGDVDRVCIVKEWRPLNRLFRARKKVLASLEALWVEYFRINNIDTMGDLAEARLLPSAVETLSLRTSASRSLAETLNAEAPPNADAPQNAEAPLPTNDPIDNSSEVSPAVGTDSDSLAPDALAPDIEAHIPTPSSPRLLISDVSDQVLNQSHQSSENPFPSHAPQLLRPKIKKHFFGLLGKELDAINYYTGRLAVIDKEIKRHRNKDFSPSSTAFVTMKSVAQAQMLAQAVLDPKVDHLITSLAPAPHDIIWDNLCLTRKERNTRIFFVMVFIGFASVLLVLPVRFLSNFLKIKSIAKVAPKLADFLKAHSWAEYLVTGILPPYVFTIFNIVMPYFYIWATKHQGYTSRADEELLLVSKNFFYIFVNLFLVFTLFGTATLTDTAQLAYQLADLLQKLSLFYVDLIILQGIGIFPYKLLLFGTLIQYPIKNMWSRTPRSYLKLYKPPVFNFGLQLPQPILVLIITVTYSVISTKILTAGLLYFLIGYFVFKYQLLYACVHPPHNTGKVWPLIVRRVILGLLIFHTMMFGTLASEKAFACASALIPLPPFTLFVLWQFHKHYIPLSSFIALRAIENNNLPHHRPSDSSNRQQTLDELREFNQNYEFPNLICDLDGPLVAVEDNEALYVAADGSTTRKEIPLFS